MTRVRVERLAAGGDGVARLPDGRAVFVPRTAPGDLVELTALREHRRYARARVGRVVEPSSERVEPRCGHYVADECGGCQLQHLAIEPQREARRRFVGDALRRIARREVADPELVPAARDFDYRTKITLAADLDGRIGLHPYDRPDRVFELEWCHITVPELMRLRSELRTMRARLPDGIDRVILRMDREGRRHLVLRGTGAWGGGAALARELARRGLSASVWWHPPGENARPADGSADTAPATVFEQVNPEMGDAVRAHAVELLGPVAGRAVWDLYAGIGETTAILAGAGARVESVEADPRAVAEADARGPSARRLAGRIEAVLGRLRRPELVVTNPPRTGMSDRVTAALTRLAPERIVYISCDPATLARDVGRLPDYRITALRAFDLFPQTAHVETVTALERVS